MRTLISGLQKAENSLIESPTVINQSLNIGNRENPLFALFYLGLEAHLH